MYLTLTDDEMAALDGKCSPENQAKVDEAKARLEASLGKENPELWRFIADIKTYAAKNGKLGFRYENDRGKCRLCGKGGGYYPYKRGSRYHAKGSPNYDKPKTIYSVDLDGGFVRINHRVGLGCCRECWDEHRDDILAQIDDVAAEMPELLTGHAARFKMYEKYKCVKCGWTGHEGEMRQLRALMQGTYPGGCPACPASNELFGPRNLELLHEKVVVPVAADAR